MSKAEIGRNVIAPGRVRLACLPLLLLSAMALAGPGAVLESEGDDPEALQAPAPVYVVRLKSDIGPASVELVRNALGKAEEGGAQLLIIEIDTPGGLAKSSREISQLLINAPVAVAVYVAPGGAHAASAGTFILYAAHLAVMAPATNIGAATPVQLPGTQSPGGDGQDMQEEVQAGQDTLLRKAENDAVAHIRGLAELHGRNVEWAEAAVREAEAISAGRALELGVIEFVAESRQELLRQADGRELKVAGQVVTMNTADAALVEIEPGLIVTLLGHIASPQTAGIMLGLGLSLIPLEFFVGAGGIAAMTGLVLCLIGAYGLGLLPLSSQETLLILTALMLSAGLILGWAGLLIALVLAIVGGLLALDLWISDLPVDQVVTWLVIFAAGALILATVFFMLWQSHRRVRSGAEEMLGQKAEVLEDFSRQGWVRIAGERWKARIPGGARTGEELKVVGRQGLLLHLEREGPAAPDAD